jgi:hypothetical protein
MPYFVGQTPVANVDGMRLPLEQARGSRMDAIGGNARRAYFADPERSNRPALAKEVAPTTLQLPADRKTLPDLVNGPGSFNMRVSDKVRVAIELFEPDQHYFFPQQILKRDGEPWPEPYWGFTAGPSALVQVMIVEQSPTLAWKLSDLGGRYIYCVDRYGDLRPISNASYDSATGFVLDEAAVRGRALVLESVLRARHVFFFSDELVAELKLRKVRGFKFVRVRTEARQVPPYGETRGMGDVR